ncbi:MAG TPA: hypothetical protein VIV60_28385 [Polyangiaceae bacterium]
MRNAPVVFGNGLQPMGSVSRRHVAGIIRERTGVSVVRGCQAIALFGSGYDNKFATSKVNRRDMRAVRSTCE